MIKELAKALPDWTIVKRTRCFAHIINLVAKSLLKQFDVIKRPADGEENKSAEDDHELYELAAGLNEEEQQTVEEGDGDGDDDMPGDDNETGWVDELADMDDEACEDLLKSIRPVSRVLFKVCFYDYLLFILTALLASKACLQNYPFYYYSSTSIEILSQSSKPCDQIDAARCLDTMELYA